MALLTLHILIIFYITSDAPATINNDPNDPGNTAVGALGRWKCTFAQRGTAGCPAANAITAVRIAGLPASCWAIWFCSAELTTANNNGAEWYTNNFKSSRNRLSSTGNIQ